MYWTNRDNVQVKGKKTQQQEKLRIINWKYWTKINDELKFFFPYIAHCLNNGQETKANKAKRKLNSAHPFDDIHRLGARGQYFRRG